MFLFVKHLRAFVFETVPGHFSPFWGVMFTRCLPEIKSERAALWRPGHQAAPLAPWLALFLLFFWIRSICALAASSAACLD